MGCRNPKLSTIKWQEEFLLIHLAMTDKQGGSDFDSRDQMECSTPIWVVLEPTHYWMA